MKRSRWWKANRSMLTTVNVRLRFLMRLEVRERTIGLGERIVLTARDFDEIAFGCFFYGSQLALRLPQPTHVQPL
jgi:hypothetical protein